METEFINPNLHVALVHFPIALLVFGVLIEAFSFMWRRHGFRAAGRWMILLGALTGLPTALSGVYALDDIGGGLSPPARELLIDHLWLTSIATLLAAGAAIAWLACSDGWRARLHLPVLGVLLIAAGLLLAGAWHAGEAVYRCGAALQAAAPTTAPAAGLFGICSILPPEQVHVILAGSVVAIALAALGLSIRKITQGPPVTQVDYIAAALGGPSTLIGGQSADASEERWPDPQDVNVPRIPSARFWLLCLAATVITALTGWWLLASTSDLAPWAISRLWSMAATYWRTLAHVIGGGLIAVLSVILAILARLAPRQKWPLTICAVLLLLAVAAQIWLGVLLMFDGPEGSVMKFN